jgi:hypothetical protein
MNFFSRIFKGWGHSESDRGWSVNYPLLSDGPADSRSLLQGFACAKGHRLEIRRAGSVEGYCPVPRSHMPKIKSDDCIVDAYHVRCEVCGETPRTVYIDAHHPTRPEQAPIAGLRRAATRKGPTRTITLDYDDGNPAWRLSTVQPSRFRDVRYSIQTHLFRLPEGALIGILFNLYDIPNQPYFIHRIMDLSDPEVERYVEACIRHKKIVTVFESKGEEIGFRRDIKIDTDAWRECLLEGRAHNAAINADGDKALEIFLEIFHRISRERGVEPAWEEIERRCVHRRP